jgi:hypothetical protein
MDINKIIKELRSDRDEIERAIIALERWSGVYSMLPGHRNGSSGSPFTVRKRRREVSLRRTTPVGQAIAFEGRTT